MLSFDTSRNIFLLNGKELELSQQDKEQIRAITWTQSIQFTSTFGVSGLREPSVILDKHRLTITDWKGKRVLVIGCFEGFEAFYIEAQGAAEVVLVQDDFFAVPSNKPGQVLLKEIFKSKVRLLDKKVSQLSKEIDGEFDLVLFCDALTHLPETFESFRRVAEMARDELIVSSPFFVSRDQFPICVLFDQYGADDQPRGICGPSRTWIYCALDQFNFHIIESRIWETDHMVVYLKRRDKPRKLAKSPRLEELPSDNGMEAHTAVLMVSCERYQQAWLPFFTLFQRYWPDCPYKMYLASDFGAFPGVLSLNSGETGSPLAWTRTLMAALSTIPEERVIFFQEDFLIQSPVDTKKIRQLVRHAYDYNLASLRLMPSPPPTSKWHGCSDIGVYGPFDNFRFSLQCSVWNRTIFLSLLSGDEDPWTCEFAASRRSQIVQWPFLGTWNQAINYYCTGIVQGQWEEGALELLKKEQIPMDAITKRL